MRLSAKLVLVTICLCSVFASVSKASESITFMADGGWCWYQDPRAAISNGKLIIGGISGQSGDVKVSVYDLKKKKDLGTVVLHEKFQADDHNAPAFYVRPDGSVLAVYAKHASERAHRYRISDPEDYLKWGDEVCHKHVYTTGWGTTYMNLFYLKGDDLLYNFYRDGHTINPGFITSKDHGKTWSTNTTHFIKDEVNGFQRPYARYFQRDPNTVGISFTEAHPRKFGTSLYYADYRDGKFYTVKGRQIKNLSDGPLVPSEAELIYKGSGTAEKAADFESVPNSAWSCAMATDADGHPHLGYTLYLTNEDHRYRLASWDGKAWTDREIAYAGNCLYTKESSYTGLFAIDPLDPVRLVISTDVDPSTGNDLDGIHEIYMGSLAAGADVSTIMWEPITKNSKHRNIRPIIIADEGYKVVLWMSGPYNTYESYNTDVVGLILETP